MLFAPPKYKALIRDWQDLVSAVTLYGNRLEVVNNFKYFRSLIAPGIGVGEEDKSGIAKVRATFTNLRHLWRRHGIRLFLQGRVHNITVCYAFLYGCQTWPIRTEDAQQLSVFDHRFRRVSARVWRENRVSDDQVHRRVLDADSRND